MQYFVTCCESYIQVWGLNLGEEGVQGGGERDEGEEDEEAGEFYCPITCDLMTNPVRCSDGFTYEESAIR